MELNPNHPMTQAIRPEWYKIAIIFMLRNGDRHTVIDHVDLRLLDSVEGCSIAVQDKDDGLHLTIVTADEAEQLLATHGGRPS